MKKIVLLGNCQLENIGNFIDIRQTVDKKFQDIKLLWHRHVRNIAPQEYKSLFRLLDEADVIYAHYVPLQHGVYATAHLQKYFNIKIVPTMKSSVSTPQIDYWSIWSFEPIPCRYNIENEEIDFRILEMYLKGIDVDTAEKIYDEVKIDEEAARGLIDKSIAKYKEKFDKGQICFNYADYYAEALQYNIECFFTMDHPGNSHLEWLLNNILEDIGYEKGSLDWPAPLLKTHWPPSFRNNILRKGKYIFNSVDMKIRTVIKIYYGFFDGFDKKFLESELKKSLYRAICTSTQ